MIGTSACVGSHYYMPPQLLQVAKGLEYLHKSDPRVVHGDLRGDNILISSTGVACIGDFGLSQKITLESEEDYSNSWKRAGNVRYMAPELLKATTYEQGPRTTQTDIFALGRVMYQLLAMAKPFANTNELLIPAVVVRGKIPSRPRDVEGARTRGFNDAMWRLMKKCWTQRPDQRPNATEVAHKIRKIKGQRGARPWGLAFSSIFTLRW